MTPVHLMEAVLPIANRSNEKSFSDLLDSNEATLSEILQSPKVKKAIAKTPISEADAGNLLKSLADAARKDTKLEEILEDQIESNPAVIEQLGKLINDQIGQNSEQHQKDMVNRFLRLAQNDNGSYERERIRDISAALSNIRDNNKLQHVVKQRQDLQRDSHNFEGRCNSLIDVVGDNIRAAIDGILHETAGRLVGEGAGGFGEYTHFLYFRCFIGICIHIQMST